MTIMLFISLWAPVFLWASLIFYVSHIPGLQSGFEVWDTLLRKCAHVFEFAVLTFLLLRALGQTARFQSKKYLYVWSGLLALLYAMSDEWHQSFVPGRGPSGWDVLIDSVGIALVLYIHAKRMKMQTTFAALALLPLMFSLVSCGPEAKFKKAESLEKKGKYYQAWQKYQQFTADYPKHPKAAESLFHAGWLSQKQLKDCSMAAVFYDAVMEKYPQSEPWARLAVNQKNNCPDYFPLYAGTKWVEVDSDTKGKNARIETECKQASEKGVFPSESGVFVKTYYAGSTKFKTIQLTYRKSNDEVLEFAAENELRAKVILKFPMEVGMRWRTRSATHMFTYEIIANDATVKVQAGEFSSCLVVRSSAEGVPGATLDYYAPGVGRVLTAFSTAQGEKRNVELSSYVAAPDFDFKDFQTKP
ncbi:MAG: hypothetical protein KCHDKBKB_01985 [Elusimicrobia bacterium]|nr:hypothetical protein [Elusimicrobiota bacterium]